jgi:hypothetical protein
MSGNRRNAFDSVARTRASPRNGTSFRERLEAAQRVVMAAHRCTEDQAFDELLDVAFRHHLDFAQFITQFAAIADHGASVLPVGDPCSARAVALEHWQLLAGPNRRQHAERTAR